MLQTLQLLLDLLPFQVACGTQQSCPHRATPGAMSELPATAGWRLQQLCRTDGPLGWHRDYCAHDHASSAFMAPPASRSLRLHLQHIPEDLSCLRLPCRVVRPLWGRRPLALRLTRAHFVIRQSEGQTKRQVLRLAPGRRVARLVWRQRLLASNEVTFACISLRGKAPGSSPDPWPACPVARTSRETRCRRGLRPHARPATPRSLTV